MTEDLRQARALLEAGKVIEGQAICKAVLRRDPSHRGALMLQGIALLRSKELPAALAAFESLTALEPNQANGWLHRGLCLIGLGRFDEAAACLERSTTLQPGNVIALYHHGGALTFLGRFTEALPILDRARALAPGDPAIQNIYASTLKWVGGTDEAMRQYDVLTTTFPDFAPGWIGKSLLHLALGDYPEGWKLNEWRLRVPGRSGWPEIARLPRWCGQAVPRNSTILLHSDAGLGDAVQFCRLASLVAAGGARVSLLVPRSLGRIMRSVEGVEQVIVEGDPIPDFDFQCPLMSLPHALGITTETVPVNVPYLDPSADLIEMWRRRLKQIHGPRIGLVWSAAARAGEPWADAYGRRRSMALATLAPLATVPGIEFVSLQFGAGAEQAKHPPPGMTLHDFGDALGDFEETAALIANLDLVISVDTAAAHLAGAIGKPVWLMSAFDMDWRWILGRTDSPWYPRHRLFRQPISTDWASVVDDVTGALRDLASARGLPRDD